MKLVILRKALAYMGTTLALYACLLGASRVIARPVLGPSDGSIQVEELARKAPAELDRKLKDYPSARFRDVTGHYVDYAADRYFYLCGFLNSKNSFGGYRGWMPFMFSEAYAPHMVSRSPSLTTQLTLTSLHRCVIRMAKGERSKIIALC